MIYLYKEDGTGLPEANVYADLDDAEAYLFLYGVPEVWENASELEKKRALLNGARWVDSAVRWGGTKLNSNQGLELPREGMYDGSGSLVEGVPPQVRQANIEAAALHLESGLFSTSNVSLRRETYGDTSIEYAGFRSSNYGVKIDYLQKLLGNYGSNSVNIIQTFRA